MLDWLASGTRVVRQSVSLFLTAGVVQGKPLDDARQVVSPVQALGHDDVRSPPALHVWLPTTDLSREVAKDRQA